MIYKHSQGTHKAITRHIRQNLYCKIKVINTTYIKFLCKLLQAQQVSLSYSISTYNPYKSKACSTTFGVVVVVILPHLVLQLPPLHHAWCCRCCHRGAIGVAVAIIMPCMVSWALLSCHMGVRAAVVTLRMMLQALSSWCDWCCGCYHHAMVCAAARGTATWCMQR